MDRRLELAALGVNYVGGGVNIIGLRRDEMPTREQPCAPHERSLLSGVEFDLEEMRCFITRTVPRSAATIMPVIEKLWNGIGVTHEKALPRVPFYARGPGPAHAHSTISLDQDFQALRLAAKQWLPARPNENPNRYDPGRGWTINDPIGRLIKFQRYKFERLALAGRAVAVQEAAVAPAPSPPDRTPTTPDRTPTKRSGKRPRADAEASGSRDTGCREEELWQQLAAAHAEPQALNKLSLGETRLLKRELQSALRRCEEHEEKLEAAEKECVVCCNGAKKVVFLPCRHLATCAACAQHPQMKLCPICREPIAERMPIFLS